MMKRGRKKGKWQAVKLNVQPITNITYFVDTKLDFSEATTYIVSAISTARNQNRQIICPSRKPAVLQYRSIPRQTPEGNISIGYGINWFEFYFVLVALTPYKIASSSTLILISASFLNLIQYPVTLALPKVVPNVWAR